MIEVNGVPVVQIGEEELELQMPANEDEELGAEMDIEGNLPQPSFRARIFDELEMELPVGTTAWFILAHFSVGLLFYIIFPVIVEGRQYFFNPIPFILIFHILVSVTFSPCWNITGADATSVLLLLARWVLSLSVILALATSLFFWPPDGILIRVLALAGFFEIPPFYFTTSWVLDAIHVAETQEDFMRYS